MPRQRILLAHGNVDCRKIYGSVLLYHGYEVDAADDMGSALSFLASGHYDLIVGDLYLHGAEDECLIRVLRSSASTAHLPVIVLTGWTTEPHRSLALQLGAERFLPLPLRPRELLAIIAQVIDEVAVEGMSALSKSDASNHHVAKGI